MTSLPLKACFVSFFLLTFWRKKIHVISTFFRTPFSRRSGGVVFGVKHRFEPSKDSADQGRLDLLSWDSRAYVAIFGLPCCLCIAACRIHNRMFVPFCFAVVHVHVHVHARKDSDEKVGHDRGSGRQAAGQAPEDVDVWPTAAAALRIAGEAIGGQCPGYAGHVPRDWDGSATLSRVEVGEGSGHDNEDRDGLSAAAAALASVWDRKGLDGQGMDKAGSRACGLHVHCIDTQHFPGILLHPLHV